jgi:hypothetical protein
MQGVPWRHQYAFLCAGAPLSVRVSAGSLLAARLWKVSDWTVLLIEAGGEEKVLQKVCILAEDAQLKPENWSSRQQPASV